MGFMKVSPRPEAGTSNPSQKGSIRTIWLQPKNPQRHKLQVVAWGNRVLHALQDTSIDPKNTQNVNPEASNYAL